MIWTCVCVCVCMIYPYIISIKVIWYNHWNDWCWSCNSNIWSPDVNNWLIWEDSVAGKDWRQEEKGTTEDVWLDGITNIMDRSSRKLLELVLDRGFWNPAVWESHFLGRLIRTLGVPKEREVWNSQGGRKDKLFFSFLCIPYDYITIMYPVWGQFPG